MHKVCPRCGEIYPISANVCKNDKQFLDQSTIRKDEALQAAPEIKPAEIEPIPVQQAPNRTVRSTNGFVRLEILALGKMIKVESNSAIGRAIQPELSNENTVSRRHCIIFPGPDGLRVRDNNSTNGTLVNNRRLSAGESCLLAVGDTLQLGAVALRIVELAAR